MLLSMKVFEFWPDVAPNTVANFKKLAKTGYFDGQVCVCVYACWGGEAGFFFLKELFLSLSLSPSLPPPSRPPARRFLPLFLALSLSLPLPLPPSLLARRGGDGCGTGEISVSTRPSRLLTRPASA